MVTLLSSNPKLINLTTMLWYSKVRFCMSAETQPIPDDKYRQEAARLVTYFGDEVTRAQNAFLEECEPKRASGEKILEAIDADTPTARWSHIGQSNISWPDFADALINGYPTTIYAVEPALAGRVFSYNVRQVTGHVAGLLSGALQPAKSGVTIVPVPETGLGKDEEVHCLSSFADAVRGIFSQNGYNGDIVDFHTASEPEGLERRLQHHGTMIEKNGNISFLPELKTVPWDWADHLGGISVRCTDAKYSQPSILAELLDTNNRSRNQLVIADMVTGAKMLWGTNILLDALHKNGDLAYSTLAIRNNRESSHLATYILARNLQLEIQDCLDAMERFRDSGTDPGWTSPYVRRNYGEGVNGKTKWDILPEDIQLMDFLIEKLPQYFKPGTVHSYRNIGRGPFSYLDALFEPFMRPDAVMRLQDPSQEAREFSRAWKEGVLPPEFAGMGLKFEQCMIAIGGQASGHLWRGSDERARRLSAIEPGNLKSLQGSHELEVEAFTSCSTSRKESGYRQAIRDRASVAGRGVITLSMLGSKGWADYPSVELTPDQVLDAHKSAGLTVKDYCITNTEVKARAGYQGMMAVIALK